MTYWLSEAVGEHNDNIILMEKKLNDDCECMLFYLKRGIDIRGGLSHGFISSTTLSKSINLYSNDLMSKVDLLIKRVKHRLHRDWRDPSVMIRLKARIEARQIRGSIGSAIITKNRGRL